LLPEEREMSDRLQIEDLLRGLYAARVRGDLEGVCRSFSNNATFEIAGASHSSPIAVSATGVGEFRPLLALMIKTFKLSEHAILAVIIDGAAVAVHWRAQIYSRITGTTVPTELVDIIKIGENGHIVSYTELFAPRRR
jgi:ketosteroid isomerase-like protein